MAERTPRVPRGRPTDCTDPPTNADQPNASSEQPQPAMLEDCALAAWTLHATAFSTVHGSLQAKASEVRERREALKQRRAALAEQNGLTDVKGTDRLTINVGGSRVRVPRSTVTQIPDTILEALFSGRWDQKLLRDQKGRIFLDLPPRCFRKIVNFLNLLKISGPDDPPELPEVQEEDREAMDRLCRLFGAWQSHVSSSALCCHIHDRTVALAFLQLEFPICGMALLVTVCMALLVTVWVALLVTVWLGQGLLRR